MRESYDQRLCLIEGTQKEREDHNQQSELKERGEELRRSEML
jgi:hypothetical protein